MSKLVLIPFLWSEAVALAITLFEKSGHCYWMNTMEELYQMELQLVLIPFLWSVAVALAITLFEKSGHCYWMYLDSSNINKENVLIPLNRVIVIEYLF